MARLNREHRVWRDYRTLLISSGKINQGTQSLERLQNTADLLR